MAIIKNNKPHTPSTVAPNLVNLGTVYDRGQMLQLLNQLRLYLNQNDSTNDHIIEHVGGLTSLHWLGDS
jgi:hypothetical protein